MRRNRKDTARAYLDAWFTSPPEKDFVGVVVYQRKKLAKRGPNRIGIAADTYLRDRYVRLGASLMLPFTNWPSLQWGNAGAVGFATTLQEALLLMQIEGSKPPSGA